jgi:hypothetical protein
MTKARTDRIRAVSSRRGVRPRVHAGVDAGTSAARAVTYPRPAEDKKLDEVGRALKLVGLDHLVEHVEEEAPCDQMLSGGEKQRLAFARIGSCFIGRATPS